MSLLTENNRQYYEGAQSFRVAGNQSAPVPSLVTEFTTTFDTDLVFGSYDPLQINYALNNFKIYHSSTGIPNTWTEYTSPYFITDNTITFGGSSTAGTQGINASYVDLIDTSFTETIKIGDWVIIEGAVFTGGVVPIAGRTWAQIDNITTSANPAATRYEWNSGVYGTATYDGPNIGGPGANVQVVPDAIFSQGYLVVQLKKLDGGNYGSNVLEKAYGQVVEDNWGSYAYTKLDDIINNFLVAYVGTDKLITSVKRTDVIFHAKRAMQEFSYDTLKSVNSQELTIPHNLSVVLPQDYVNYVNLYWVDNQGVQHPILPTNNLTSNPYTIPLQDDKGVPTQDNFDNNITGTSIVEDRWKNNYLEGNYPDNSLADNPEKGWEYYYGWPEFGYGQLYGLDPKYGNINGYFNINEREGKMSFSANLVDKIIVFEYISDGLSTNLETRVPKLAEEAMYAYISHAIIASKINQPEYIVQRLKREASAKLRNAKIRLSNIKLDQIVQVMRGKSKWIKH